MRRGRRGRWSIGWDRCGGRRIRRRWRRGGGRRIRRRMRRGGGRRRSMRRGRRWRIGWGGCRRIRRRWRARRGSCRRGRRDIRRRRRGGRRWRWSSGRDRRGGRRASDGWRLRRGDNGRSGQISAGDEQRGERRKRNRQSPYAEIERSHSLIPRRRQTDTASPLEFNDSTAPPRAHPHSRPARPYGLRLSSERRFSVRLDAMNCEHPLRTMPKSR